MKIGIFSDIHGNITAFREVLREAKSLNITKLFICGDFVDYYYSPEEVLKELENWEFVAIKGNHEEYLFEAMGNTEMLSAYTAKYGHGLEKAIRKLSGSQIEFLKALPASRSITVEGFQFHLFHGSPDSISEYVYPDTNPERLEEIALKSPIGSIIILGHTHYPFLSLVKGRVILNPGSVGQARQRGGQASWVAFDTSNGSIVFHNTAYHVESVIAEVDIHDPDKPYLRNVLQRKII